MPTPPNTPAPAAPKKPDPHAHWIAVKAKVGKTIGAGALAWIDQIVAGKVTRTGDPVLDLGLHLLQAIGCIEKALADKRMKPKDAAARQQELAAFVAQLAMPAPKVPVAEATAPA